MSTEGKMKVVLKSEKTRNLLFLLLIIFLGVFFRLRQWPDYLTFDFEKSRDAIASRNIYQNKKPTLLGPTTEVDGLYHGPLYYYLAGFFYHLADGDPRAGSAVSFFFNLACIPILYFIGKDLFNRKIGLLAAFLYAVSFEAVSYAYWLSNPGPSVPFLFLMFYYFYKFCKNGENYLAKSFFCLGISIQFQVLNIIFVFPLFLLYLLSIKPKINFKNVFNSFMALTVPLSTFILFEIRHKFLMTNVFFSHYFGQKKETFSFRFQPLAYLQRLGKEISDIFLPTSNTSGLIILFLIIVFLFFKLKKQKNNFVWKFLLVWLFSTLPIFLINSRMSQSNAAFIAVSGAVILVFSVLLAEIISNKNKLIFIIALAIFLSNLSAVDNCLTHSGCRLFDFFQGQFLKRNLEIVNYVYENSQNQNFRLDTVTSPLYVSTVWDYLFEWYGRKNKLSLPVKDNALHHFLLLEPFVDEFYKKQAIEKKQAIGLMIEEKYFNGHSVQKWIID